MDEETGLCYYEQRYYDPLKSYFLGVDQLADKYPHISGFAYVANNPLIFVDPDGRKKYKFGTYIVATTGKIGIAGKILGVPLGASYTKGGVETEIKIFVEFDSDNLLLKFGASYGNKKVDEANEVLVGFHGGESREMESTYEFNTNQGIVVNEESVYKNRSFGGIGPITQEETFDGKNYDESIKSDFGVGVDLHMGILGVGLGLDIEIKKSDSNKETNVKVLD